MPPTRHRPGLSTGSTHRDRPFPPRGWSIEATPGWGRNDQEPSFTRIQDALADIPSRFVLSIQTDDVPPIRMALFFAADPNGVTLEAVKAHPIDAVAATDLLRKYAPIEDWQRQALFDLSFRMAMHSAVQTGNAETMLQAMGFSEATAREVAGVFGTGETWVTSQASNIGPISLDDPAWQSALAGWRGQLEGEGFGASVESMSRRRAPRRNRVTAEHLAEVAEVYRVADKEGRAPTMAVAEHFGTSHRTATRWVKAARDLGKLGPTVPGKGGELAEDDEDRDEES